MSLATRGEQVTIVDLLDRLLGAGVVIAGEVVISIADVDLVQVSLRALVTSVRAEFASQGAVRGVPTELQYAAHAELESEAS